jgi:hypothetical protein
VSEEFWEGNTDEMVFHGEVRSFLATEGYRRLLFAERLGHRGAKRGRSFKLVSCWTFEVFSEPYKT